MKKVISIFFIFLLTLVCFTACDDDPADDVKTGKVTFFNESSYKVIVHRDAFSGPVILELNPGQSKTMDVRVSDNYGVGTTFSIEYLRAITDGTDKFAGEVLASMIDPNVQITRIIEENKPITIQIPQPKNLEARSAFITILNSSSLPCELRYLGQTFKQTGNDNIPIPPIGGIGIYKIDGIPPAGLSIQNYQIVSTFDSTTIDTFTAQNGFIYNFIYDGSAVKPNELNPIMPIIIK